MRHYRNKLYGYVKWGRWEGMELDMSQVSYLLSLEFLPCEICLKHYAADAYDKVEEGIELDHIEPVNRENALQSEGHGDPFSFDNLQLLCRFHHSKKSQRERY